MSKLHQNHCHFQLLEYSVKYNSIMLPFLLCLSLILLSHALNRNDYGYKLKKKVFNQLFFMGDLNIFAKDDELKGVFTTGKIFQGIRRYRFRIR